jgi:DNA-directed RNA polymerase subunit RPC12/RpoP
MTEALSVTKGRLLGYSSDQRANRWRLVCPHCSEAFEPVTTMFATMVYDCPKCKKAMAVNYNKLLEAA